MKFSLCLICQENSSKKLTINPKYESFEKLKEYSKLRANVSDSDVFLAHERLSSYSVSDLLERKGFCHQDCYSNIVNKTKLERAKKRFYKARDSNDVSLVSPKVGRPSIEMTSPSNFNENEFCQKLLRSSSSPYNCELCIICQSNDKNNLRNVMLKATGIKMLKIVRNIKDKDFYIRLNSISDATDAVANDVKYHRRCWIYTQREAEGSDDNCNIEDIDDTSRVISDIEVINIVKRELIEPSEVPLAMQNVNIAYINLLKENHHPTINESYRRYLKQLLSENVADIEFIKPVRTNVADIEFIKPVRKNESERICLTKFVHETVDKHYFNTSDQINTLYNAAKIIREEVLFNKAWEFEGNFAD